jgi:16S rRNA (guanine966-N2)-methyltransferase
MDVIAEASVLDLFAGTGALGIEALSRGAATATFVDADETAMAMVRANLLRTGFIGRGKLVRGDAVRFVDTAADAGETFDVVLADPPYAFDGWPTLLARLPAAVAVLESDRPLEPGSGWSARSKRYGDSVVTLARRL